MADDDSWLYGEDGGGEGEKEAREGKEGKEEMETEQEEGEEPAAEPPAIDQGWYSGIFSYFRAFLSREGSQPLLALISLPEDLLIKCGCCIESFKVNHCTVVRS